MPVFFEEIPVKLNVKNVLVSLPSLLSVAKLNEKKFDRFPGFVGGINFREVRYFIIIELLFMTMFRSFFISVHFNFQIWSIGDAVTPDGVKHYLLHLQTIQI